MVPLLALDDNQATSFISISNTYEKIYAKHIDTIYDAVTVTTSRNT